MAYPTGPDSFEGAGFDGTIWTGSYGSGTSVDTANDWAVVDTNVGWCGRSTSNLDMTGKEWVFEFWLGNPTANNQAVGYVALKDASGDECTIVLKNNGGVPKTWFIKNGQTDLIIDHDATNHRWFRFRESGGTVYYETAPNGQTWTVRRTEAVGNFDPTFARLEFGGGSDGGAATTNAYFDNLNNPPSGPPKRMKVRQSGAWVAGVLKVRSGGAWVAGTPKHRNGSWV